MKKIALLLLVVVMISGSVLAHEKPASADEIMSEAIKTAQKDSKSIFLMFHASWCGWCKKMDASIKDELCVDYFNDNFVIIHMVVKEGEAKKHLMNPGAEEFLAKYNGDKSGIPFWLIFDQKGKLVTDSFIRKEGVGLDQPGANIGCPAQDNEVAEFIAKLEMVAPATEEQAKKITERFVQNRPAPRK